MKMYVGIALDSEDMSVVCIADDRSLVEKAIDKDPRLCTILASDDLMLSRGGMSTLSYEYDCICMEDNVRGTLDDLYPDLVGTPEYDQVVSNVADEAMRNVYYEEMPEGDAAVEAIGSYRHILDEMDICAKN